MICSKCQRHFPDPDAASGGVRIPKRLAPITNRHPREAADEIERLRKALREIAKGEGRFSTNHLTHASNTIEDMKELARAALSSTNSNPTGNIEGGA